MRYIAILAIIFAATISQGQSNLGTFLKNKGISVQKMTDDLFYKIDRQGKGRQPQKGDFVKVHYTASFTNGKKIESTFNDKPEIFQVGRLSMVEGLERGITAFKTGSKGKIYLGPNQAYGDSNVGDIPANSNIIYDIQLLDVMDSNEYRKFIKEEEKKEKTIYEKRQRLLLANQMVAIQKYSKKKKLKTKQTKSGVFYAIKKKGKGPLPKASNGLTVKFKGYLLNGKIFNDTQIFKFIIGRKAVIRGWEDALLEFPEGSKGTILVPSSLGYGEDPLKLDNMEIPANSVLVFDIELLDVKVFK